MVPKFRAWDKKYKMLMRVNQIDFLKGTAWLEADQGDHETRHTLTRCFDDVIFMQSTGFKDKNDDEIFEGDIVLENGMERIVSFGEQEYEEDFGNLAYYIGFNVYTKWGYASIYPVEYEILGNIHDNPELLESIK